MWPFKSNIPEIKTISDDENGNIEIKHSHGQFKINRKDIVDVQLTKRFIPYLEIKDNPNSTDELLQYGFLGLPLAFGVWNVLIYNDITRDKLYFHYHKAIADKFCFSLFQNFLDIIVNIGLFLMITVFIGYLISLLMYFIEYFSSENQILKLSSLGKSFEFKCIDENHKKACQETFEINTFPKNENKRISISVILFVTYLIFPFIAFVFNWDDPFWFYQNKFFETNSKIDFPLTMTNFIEYFRGEPKGFFELLVDGLASFGGTILFLIAFLIALLIGIIFFCLTVLVFFGIPLIQFVTIPYLIFYIVFSLMDKNLKINWKEEFKFPEWSLAEIITTIVLIFIGPFFFFLRTIYASFPEKPHNLKNISFWIFCFFAAISIAIGVDFLFRDFIYYPLENLFLQVKDFCEPHKLGYSLFQLEKTIYISFILTISFLTFYLLILKKDGNPLK